MKNQRKQTIDAAAAWAQLVDDANDKAVSSTREIRSIEIGQLIHQGDVYVHRVAGNHPRGKVLGGNKLAIGEGEGSNHFAEGASVVCYVGTKVPEWCRRGTFLGPVVVATDRWMVTHPKHACFSMPPGVYQVTHQMDARTLDRVRD
jgi:hypothetical protein